MTYRTVTILAALTLAASAAEAQDRPVELGIDAGLTVGLGDNSFNTINIPAQAFRVGFFVQDNISIEPKVGINSTSVNGHRSTNYRAELGLLYHFFRPGMRPYPSPGPRSSVYVRPFVGIVGSSNNDASDTNGLLGIGVGMKVPLVNRLAARFEANIAHTFGDFSSNELGILAGLSFFTR
jgi:hypothetical protein